MPIPLLSIPAHILDGIVQKLNLWDFVNFSQVSRESFVLAKNVKTRYAVEKKKEFESKLLIALKTDYLNNQFALHFDEKSVVKMDFFDNFFAECPVRLNSCDVDFQVQFFEELCDWFTEFLSITSSIVNAIYFSYVTCSTEALNRLVEIGKAAELHFDCLHEADILSLQATDFEIRSSDLTSGGARLIIKGLFAGERYINNCAITTRKSLNRDIILAGISVFNRTSDKIWIEVFVKTSCTFRVSIVNDLVGGFFSIRKID